MLATIDTIGQPYHLTDDGGMSLDFHPGQWDIWDSTKRFIFATAGTQGGSEDVTTHDTAGRSGSADLGQVDEELAGKAPSRR